MTDATPAQVMICNCQRSMPLDGRRLARDLGLGSELTVFTELCRSQVAAFEGALADPGRPLCVACTQEAPLFRELAEERGHTGAIDFINIRERAGWSASAAEAGPKIAALLADAAWRPEPTGLLALDSKGVCLVYGNGQAALDAATELSEHLSVTLLLAEAGEAMPPSTALIPIYKGRIKTAKGHLGAFEIEVDGYASMLPSSRARLEFTMARDGARSRCDLILDLTGGAALFAAGERRDGYLRADPQSPASVSRAMLKAAGLAGSFEKPLYVALDPTICAHSRNQKTGCRNCLDACPAGAIAPDGDHVAIDPAICGGCGSCSAVCPTGAVAYAYPRRRDFVARIGGMLATYRRAGGRHPVALLHDAKHGEPIIAAMARYGRGLPANVLPIEVHAPGIAGHDTMLALLASGAAQVAILADPKKPEEAPALPSQLAIAEALLTGLGHPPGRLHALAETDPEIVEGRLADLAALAPIAAAPLAVDGTKRDLARNAFARLREASPLKPDVIPLPKGSPYGRIAIRGEGCTLCLACVSACPTGALTDHPERPQVAFSEAACVQCGICAATCPEKVITLEPRLDARASALERTVLKEEPPFECVACGKPFGTRATVERVLARLKGHAMFRTEAQLRTIQMCETCRVVATASLADDPMRGPERPRVRTTDDYLTDLQPPEKPEGGT